MPFYVYIIQSEYDGSYYIGSTNDLTRISFAMGEKSPSPEAAVEAVSRLNQKLGLPLKLSEVNVLEDGIPLMA